VCEEYHANRHRYSVDKEFIKQGEVVIRGAILASTRERLTWKTSVLDKATAWWAGQLAIHSLSSVGDCSAIAAYNLKASSALETLIWRDPLQVHLDGSNNHVLGMHVRRGDSCMRWASFVGDHVMHKKNESRPCYPTDMYLEAASEMSSRYGVKVLSLATDSALAEREIRAALEPEGWTVRSLRFDREVVGGEEGTNVGLVANDPQNVFIEKRNQDGTLDKELVIGSLLAELEMLSGATMLIGTSMSQVTRLAFHLITGRLGTVPPYTFLDISFFGKVNMLG
jgi:hypothetical protein